MPKIHGPKYEQEDEPKCHDPYWEFSANPTSETKGVSENCPSSSKYKYTTPR